MNELILPEVYQALWPQDDNDVSNSAPNNVTNNVTNNGATTAYAIIDCARDSSLYEMIQSTELFNACLFAGNLSSEMRAAAPHIVKLTPTANSPGN